MKVIWRLLFVIPMAVCLADVEAAPNVPRPFIAYLCAAGGERAHLVFVTLGDTDGDRTEVLEGLKEGDRVVYAGHTDLKEGDKVFPTEWGVDGPKALPPPSSGGVTMPGHGDHGDAEMKTDDHPAHGDDHAQPAHEPTPKAKPDAKDKVVYICPMDPDVISDKPGDCSKCGMRLEPQKTR